MHGDCVITARSGAHLRHDCDYMLGGSSKRVRVFLQDTATLDPLVDPVILQVPQQATGFGGIYSDRPTNGTLRITEVVGELDADLTRKIVPEPGHKLLIVDFPTPAPPLDGRNYTFGLVFPLTNTANTVTLKALFAAKATVSGKTYYPPLYPCATNFKSIPAVTLRETSDFVAVDLTPVLAANACNGSFYTFVPIPPETVTIVEYYHAGLDHYFATALAGEMAILDAGVKIQGWTRTGHTFKAYATAQPGTSPVCRYYIPPGSGGLAFLRPRRGGVRCDRIQSAAPRAGSARVMYVKLPVNGQCPEGTTLIYRVYSNRADANHRYMADPALRDEMAARGWVVEGDGEDRVVVCTPV
jgi:hypothetical protein